MYQETNGLCKAMLALNREVRHKFIPYFSEDEMERASELFLKSINNPSYHNLPIDSNEKESSYEDYMESKSIRFQLNKELEADGEAVSFFDTIISRAQQDFAKCAEVPLEKIDVDIRMSGNGGNPALTEEQSLFWHQDGDLLDDELKDLGVRVVITLVGKPTMFSDNNPNIFTGNKVLGANVQYVNKIEEPMPGEVALFNMVEKYGTVHAAPIMDSPRLFVSLTCRVCPPVMHSEVETLQTILEEMTLNVSGASNIALMEAE